MRILPVTVAVLVLLAASSVGAAPEDVRLKHTITAELDPAQHTIRYRDVLQLSPSWGDLKPEGKEHLRFKLNAGLDVKAETTGHFDVRLVAGTDAKGATGHGEEGKAHALRIREWELVVREGAPEKGIEAHLLIEGRVHHPLVAEGVEYARSFSRTPGTIEDRGVFLGGASWWVPRFGDELVTYTLTVDLPQGWDAVSQGKRTKHDTQGKKRTVTWDCPHDMDEIYLIANRFVEYSRSSGNLTAYVFLREEDPNLANKYLEVTAQYVDMYRRLIGPYPFSKFALIENFWETGYGMPSFTLLGPKVIRFPFILHSSYPHEILHNWWGNSVYVDWASGNWCEGLTAYLADHLVREGQGRGAEYRMDTLKSYRNYVDDGKDFPLREFRSRHSSATQAVGYGKCLMLFHMLRRDLGDRAFARGLARFYRQNRFRRASFGDIAEVYSGVAERDLSGFFQQWVDRPGAPELAIEKVAWSDGQVSFELVQRQAGEPFRVTVPVALTTAAGGNAGWHALPMTAKRMPVTLEAKEPVRIDVDPMFDVFRRLHRDEIPPTISEMFGATDVTIVVPPQRLDPLAAEWRALAEGWSRGRGGHVQVVESDAIQELPKGRAVWILGTRNPLASSIRGSLAARDAGPEEARYRFGLEAVDAKGHCHVYIERHPADPNLAVGWLGADRAAALPGLARKLPHYGKYSYLAFSGDEPTNVVKGRWESTSSPMVALKDGKAVARGKLPARQPLERLAPVFDPAQLKAHVDWLADDAREGRGIGTKGLDEAADYIAARFKAAGLKPGGDDGTFFQHFEVPNGPDGKTMRLRNVVGVLPGLKPEMKGQSVVLGAHYDHLGRGWPDVRDGEQGKIHNGADDNASGVAVMLEVAALLGKQLKPDRSVVFAAFSGEEWGLKGSTHYVKTMQSLPAKQAIGMVNLDAVGRLNGKKLLVLGSGTASEWQHIARGVGFTTGVQSTCVADDVGGSDQVSFHRIGVPAVQLFSGPHEDYHRSTDDADKIDVAGLVRVATWVRETVVYLTQRPRPMTSKLGGKPAESAPTGRPQTGRRVSFGSMPAFDYTGPGVKVGAVMEGSGAKAAGIQAGDILLSIDGATLKDLRAFSDVLKKHQPGDTVTVVYRRGDTEHTTKVTLKAR